MAAAKKTTANAAEVQNTEVLEEVKKTAKAAKATKKTVEAAEKAEEKAVKKPARKTAAKKAALNATISVQFAGKSYTNEELVQIAKDVWQYDLKREEKELQSVELYVKPEESTVYYVFNGTEGGSFVI